MKVNNLEGIIPDASTLIQTKQVNKTYNPDEQHFWKKKWKF